MADPDQMDDVASDAADTPVILDSAFPPSVNAGIPRLGATPAGWTRARLGDLLEVVERPTKLENDKTYRLVTAKRSRGGIVARAEMRGDAIRVKQQFYVRTGDFIISNRQIAHGGCGIVPDNLDGAIVSGEYTVLRSRGVIDLQYLAYLSHLPYFQQVCFHSSVGVHVEKLVFRLDQWLDWNFDVPSLPEQLQIVDLLRCIDRAVAGQDAMLSFARTAKQILLTRVFSHSPLGETLPPDWTHKPIRDVARTFAGGTPNRNDPSNFGGSTNWVKSGEVKGEVTGTAEKITAQGLQTSAAQLVPSGATLIAMYGANAGDVARLRIDAATNQAVLAVIAKPDEIDADMLFFACQSVARELIRKAHGSGQPNLSGEIIRDQRLILPPRPKQPEIAAALIDAERFVAATAELATLLRRQKLGLLHQLLTGNARVPLASKAIAA